MICFIQFKIKKIDWFAVLYTSLRSKVFSQRLFNLPLLSDFSRSVPSIPSFKEETKGRGAGRGRCRGQTGRCSPQTTRGSTWQSCSSSPRD